MNAEEAKHKACVCALEHTRTQILKATHNGSFVVFANVGGPAIKYVADILISEGYRIPTTTNSGFYIYWS